MARLIAIANQKGGVGKTTTAVNLAASLAIAERKTLLVDADPQGNATSGMGIRRETIRYALYDAIVEGRPAGDIIINDPALPFLDVLPATQDLVGAELELVDRRERETVLRRALAPIKGVLRIHSDRLPAFAGTHHPQRADSGRRSHHPDPVRVLRAGGNLAVAQHHQSRAAEFQSNSRDRWRAPHDVRFADQSLSPGGDRCEGVLRRQDVSDGNPRNVRLAEAPSFGKPILMYDIQSVGAKSYLATAQELVRRTEALSPTESPALREVNE